MSNSASPRVSKSVGRVEAEAKSLGLDIEIVRLNTGTLTARQAADAVGGEVDQIIKSVVLREIGGAAHFLFLTAGGNRVDLQKASRLAGAPLEMADAASIRAFTGFAIGGVSPLGHIRPIRTFMDPRILTFSAIWAAAGTPHHMFEIAPEKLTAAIKPEIGDFTD